jgi:hypothetical protein
MLSKEYMPVNTGEDLVPVRPVPRYFATHSTYTVLTQYLHSTHPAHADLLCTRYPISGPVLRSWTARQIVINALECEPSFASRIPYLTPLALDWEP